MYTCYPFTISEATVKKTPINLPALLIYILSMVKTMAVYHLCLPSLRAISLAHLVTTYKRGSWGGWVLGPAMHMHTVTTYGRTKHGSLQMRTYSTLLNLKHIFFLSNDGYMQYLSSVCGYKR